MARLFVRIQTEKAQKGWHAHVIINKQFLSTTFFSTKTDALAQSQSNAILWGGTLPNGDMDHSLQINATVVVIPAENNGWRVEIRVGNKRVENKTVKTQWVSSKTVAIKLANNTALRMGLPKSAIKTSSSFPQSTVSERTPRQGDFDRA